MLRFACLVLDHDDTCVDSSGTIGYPHFCQTLAQFRPGLSVSEEQFRRYCLDPGFQYMYRQIFHFTEHEIALENAMWKAYVHTHYPSFFHGIPDILHHHKISGGIICIVSHSSADVISATYQNAGLPLPDLILGSEQPPEHQKPHAWPLQEIMNRFDLKPRELLVVDDLPPGCTMARACGDSFAAAGWNGMPLETACTMQRISDYYFSTVGDFYRFLFERK